MITVESSERCFEYLKEKGSVALTDMYVVYEDDGIKGCAGISISMGLKSRVGIIEPFRTEGKEYAIKLYEYCEKFLKEAGCGYITLFVNDPRISSYMRSKHNYYNWAQDINQITKKI